MLVFLSLVGILYGAWVAFRQTDFKKLVAYSSVSHLGFVVLGICVMNPEGLTGSMLQMINHGLSTGALFLSWEFFMTGATAGLSPTSAGSRRSFPGMLSFSSLSPARAWPFPA